MFQTTDDISNVEVPKDGGHEVDEIAYTFPRPVSPVSISESDSSIEADNELEDEYVGLEKNVFKTSNRLFDDILSDLTFILTENMDEELRTGILSLPGIKYSSKLALLKYNPYVAYFSKDIDGSIEQFDSVVNPNDKITVIRGLIYSNLEPTLSRSRVYHLRIAIKTKALTEKSVSKNLFRLSKLSDDDAIDLLRQTTLREDDPESLKDCVPHIIDSASYVCELTKKVIRIEISKPELDESDLVDYEIGPIKVRQIKAHEQLGLPVPELDPSPSQCLFTLFRVMRGPLLAVPGSEIKSIGSKNKSLISHTNPRLLTEKLHFTLENNEYFPPLIHDMNDRSQVLTRESFLRQLLEISFLGTKAYSGGRPNSFTNLKFTDLKDVFFQSLYDMASVSHQKFVQQESFVLLSVYPFYSDDLIKTCYQSVVSSDPSNLPIYYDALCDVGQRQGNLKLSRFISTLNVIGQKQVNTAYKTLGIDPNEGEKLDDDLILTLYKGENSHGTSDRLRNSLKIIAEFRKSAVIEKYLRYEPMPIHEAYNIFDASESVDEEMLPTVMALKLSEYPDQKDVLIRAFVTIALARGTPELLNSVETNYPDLTEDIAFEDACRCLAIDPLATERQILSLYEVARQSLPLLKARRALRAIGEQKNSKLIRSYLETGLIDASALPANEWPVGFVNTGNSCYLNSLLQYYFVISPFRDSILNFYDIYNGDEIYKDRRIGGRLVGEDEIERSFQFTYHLRNLFREMIYTKERVITPDDALQFLAFLPATAKVEFGGDNQIETDNIKSVTDNGHATELIDIEGVDPEEQAGDSTMNDQFSKSACDSTALNGALEIKADLATEPKTAKISESEKILTLEMGRQQDVTECIGNVLSQIETAWKPEEFGAEDGEQLDLIKTLFFGKTVQNLVGLSNAQDKRTQVTRFSWLLVNINDHPRSLYDALDSVLMTTEIVDTESGKYKRTENIVELPKILQIQIQRVNYDIKLQQAFKNVEQLPLPETIYMDRYMETDDANLLQLRNDVETWKGEITQLKKQRDVLLAKNDAGMSYKDSLKVTKDWLTTNNLADQDTIDMIGKQIDKIDEMLMDIFNKINILESKIDHHFDHFKKEAYNIVALFIHRGSANYGHYWIYIKDTKKNIWRKYNDEEVSEVLESEVLNFEARNDGTPYFVAYVREGCDDLIDPLRRLCESE